MINVTKTKGAIEFHGTGVNAKMSELQAAMGLAILPHISGLLGARQPVAEIYHENLNFSQLTKMAVREGTAWNFSYYPVIFKHEEKLIEVLKALKRENIYPRRYFYPSLNKLNYIKYQKMQVSESLAKSFLCLPLAQNMDITDVLFIVKTINTVLK